jgi:hypothetical protein
MGIFVAIAVSFVVGTDALMGCVVALGSVACVNGPSMFVVRASRCRKGAGQLLLGESLSNRRSLARGRELDEKRFR